MTNRDFESLDLNKLMKGADAQFARVQELQKQMTSLVGRASDDDGLVAAEYASDGLRDLVLNPKVMRLGSGELAERVKAVVRAAAADLQRQISDAMAESFGPDDNPMKYVDDPDAGLEQVREAEAAYNRTFEDVMGELDRISRRLNN